MYKTCTCCGNKVEINVTPEMFKRLTNHRKTGENVQDIAPSLSPALREMFISRICPTCWDIMIGDEEE